MVDTQKGIDVVHGLGSDVCEFLDLGSHVLDLCVVEGQTELFDTGLDGVPASQAVTRREAGPWLMSVCLLDRKVDTYPMET